MVNHTSSEIVRDLTVQGYALTQGPLNPQEAAALAGTLGTLVPQSTGELTYDIMAHPGFEKVRDTRSAHTLRPHTEAPGQNPPPRYLALHCRVQATCGGGQTMLADAHAFVAGLSDQDRHLVHESELYWPSYVEDADVKGLWKPLVERTEHGTINRLSCTLLRTGGYSEDLDEQAGPHEPPLGAEGVALAQQALDFFQDNKVSVLIPEDAMLIWDNHRMFHSRSAFTDTRRRLTRYWIAD
ncbi:TauD/TfdA family dioxygenase [Streptomyces sp. NBC_00249]|uniref:TauD/TfdA family dioxygenase n=1 Tax=Streptomyces sp. NBC_00249 TaxID=2975690 RepID=UPI00225A95D0|nr:TauD/TfdA family dioxygenase [Streptomyces sp. NBC_00249]MCX5192551.1 TauD/TfdA family dioxygenase [Streptomyces sp. NBC_00249]